MQLTQNNFYKSPNVPSFGQLQKIQQANNQVQMTISKYNNTQKNHTLSIQLVPNQTKKLAENNVDIKYTPQRSQICKTEESYPSTDREGSQNKGMLLNEILFQRKDSQEKLSTILPTAQQINISNKNNCTGRQFYSAQQPQIAQTVNKTAQPINIYKSNYQKQFFTVQVEQESYEQQIKVLNIDINKIKEKYQQQEQQFKKLKEENERQKNLEINQSALENKIIELQKSFQEQLVQEKYNNQQQIEQYETKMESIFIFLTQFVNSHVQQLEQILRKILNLGQEQMIPEEQHEINTSVSYDTIMKKFQISDQNLEYHQIFYEIEQLITKIDLSLSQNQQQKIQYKNTQETGSAGIDIDQNQLNLLSNNIVDQAIQKYCQVIKESIIQKNDQEVQTTDDIEQMEKNQNFDLFLKEYNELKKLGKQIKENINDNVEEYEIQIKTERDSYMQKINELSDQMQQLVNELDRVTQINSNLINITNDEKKINLQSPSPLRQQQQGKSATGDQVLFQKIKILSEELHIQKTEKQQLLQKIEQQQQIYFDRNQCLVLEAESLKTLRQQYLDKLSSLNQLEVVIKSTMEINKQEDK